MTSDDRLSLILRRLDEIERKLDQVLEELRTPHGHRLFGTPGQLSKEGLRPSVDEGCGPSKPKPICWWGLALVAITS